MYQSDIPLVDASNGQVWETKGVALDLVAGEGLEPPTPGL